MGLGGGGAVVEGGLVAVGLLLQVGEALICGGLVRSMPQLDVRDGGVGGGFGGLANDVFGGLDEAEGAGQGA